MLDKPSSHMTSIRMPHVFRDQMIEHAVRELPNECCGVLLGKEVTASQVVPMRSAPPAPDAYFMDPLQQVEVFTAMEERGESLLGIYHSHPGGPAEPSGADRQLAFHPEVVYIIISLADQQRPELKAFVLHNRCFEEISIEYLR
jgi:proteasome lid subunit RPN8/RPN11